MTGGTSRSFPLPSGSCGLPSNATAYSLNVTVVPSVSLTYLTLWPTGQPQPGVSTLNSFDGRVKADAAITGAGTGGAVSVYVTDTTHVVIDVDGYFISTGTLAFYSITPCRLADTRNPPGTFGGPRIEANQFRSFPVLSGSCGIPSNVQAYLFNVTAVPPGALWFLTIWPTGVAQPLASTLNDYTGTVVANAAIVPAGSPNGAVSVYVSNASDVVLDINGYLAPPGTGGLAFYPLAPCRAVDDPALAAVTTTNYVLNGTCGLPQNAAAYSLNATVVPTSGYLSYLKLWPQGAAQPPVSLLNSWDGSVVSNAAIVSTTNGWISAFATDPVHLMLDVNGYFAPVSQYTANTIADLNNCIQNLTQYSTCALAPGTYPVTSAINVNRYGVTVSGGAADRRLTRLVRGATLTDPLIRVSVTDATGATRTMRQAAANQGVVVQNLTICGGGNTHPNVKAGPPYYGNPAAMSPAGSPCGDQHVPAPSQCDYASHKCVDLSVDSVAVDLNPASGYYPTQPFSYAGPYALELKNVDLEDAAGHALRLYAADVYTDNQGITHPALKVNDIWIHDSAISYSAITGILFGYNFVTYDDKFCDHYAEHNTSQFYDDPVLVAPRNIRMEHNDLRYNNTGVMGGGAARWVGLRNNTFYVNYISPQDGNFGGGAIEFDRCADQVEISYNTITGPNSSTGIPPSGYAPFNETGALELYGRNFNIHDNTITGHSSNGIGAYSLLSGTISQNHVLQDNNWSKTTGGIEVGTSFAEGACDAVPRDTNGVAVIANDSNPIDVNNNNTTLPTGPATQAFGVLLSDHGGGRGTDRLIGVTVDSGNFSGAHPLYHLYEAIFLDPFVGLYGTPVPAYSNNVPPEVGYPRLLPVDVTSASASLSSFSPLWPTPPRCSDRLGFWPPPGSRKGSSRAMFKFSASDRGNATSLNGANNIAGIWGIFSVTGNDTDGSGGPSAAPGAPDQGLCNFSYDAVTNLVYLGDGNGGWLGPSVVGSGGQDLATSGGCVIHAATSTSWISLGMPQAVPTAYVVDLTLDVTLPAAPANKYHIYGYAENKNYLFDACGSYAPGTCPNWKYWGYWWNIQ